MNLLGFSEYDPSFITHVTDTKIKVYVYCFTNKVYSLEQNKIKEY